MDMDMKFDIQFEDLTDLFSTYIVGYEHEIINIST